LGIYRAAIRFLEADQEMPMDGLSADGFAFLDCPDGFLLLILNSVFVYFYYSGTFAWFYVLFRPKQ
jgi:hypothetical protein